MNKGRNSALALAAAVMGLGLAACGDDTNNTTADGGVKADGGTTGNPDATVAECTGTHDTTTGAACPGFVAVGFRIDDSANQTYTADDFLAWKGSFDFDSTTRELSVDTGWAPPFPLLYDDGPISAGGHEVVGATAGDHIWSVATYVKTPATGEPALAFEYGAIRNSNANGDDGGWIWTGPNGTFTVAAGDTGSVNATALTIAPFGDRDWRLTLDVAAVKTASISGMMPYADVDPALGVSVKSSAWGWFPVQMTDNGMNGDLVAGDDIFTFVLSEHDGVAMFKHVGLLNMGAMPEFVFMFGPFMPNGEGREYKGGDGNQARPEGVTAATRTGDTGTFVETPVVHVANGNTSVTVP
jgi:hypothetical protein